MLCSICYKTYVLLYNTKTKAVWYMDFCYVTIFMLCNKKVCCIAHPNLPDVCSPTRIGPGRVTAYASHELEVARRRHWVLRLATWNSGLKRKIIITVIESRIWWRIQFLALAVRGGGRAVTRSSGQKLWYAAAAVLRPAPGCPSPAAGFMASVITDTLLQTPSQNGMSAADSESRPEKWCTVTQALTAHVEQVEATKNFLFSADREALTNRRHCSRPRGLEVNRDIRIVPAEAAMLALVRG